MLPLFKSVIQETDHKPAGGTVGVCGRALGNTRALQLDAVFCL